MRTPPLAIRALGMAALLCAVPAGPAPALDPAVLDSVVSVIVPPEVANPEEPEGSGVAVRPGGLIVTNMHVVSGVDQVTVRLADGRRLPGQVIGRDAPTDLALLRVEAELPVLAIGPEPTLAQPVCAIGNAFGLDLAVTCGVVSATRRSGVGFNAIEDFIQTDAAINPGSSGGALVDMQGRLVGIVSVIFTKNSDANIGVNFAASTRLMQRVVDDLAAHGEVLRGRPGWRVTRLPAALAGRIVGAAITEVEADAAASKAGIRRGDVLVSIAGRNIRRPSDVAVALHLHRPGDSIPVSVLRAGQPLTRTMILE